MRTSETRRRLQTLPSRALTGVGRQLHRKAYKTGPALLPCETAMSAGREISTTFPAGTTEEQLSDMQQGQRTLLLTVL